MTRDRASPRWFFVAVYLASLAFGVFRLGFLAQAGAADAFRAAGCGALIAIGGLGLGKVIRERWSRAQRSNAKDTAQPH